MRRPCTADAIMGAALSTSNNGILVALERPQFAPGDVVQAREGK